MEAVVETSRLSLCYALRVLISCTVTTDLILHLRAKTLTHCLVSSLTVLQLNIKIQYPLVEQIEYFGCIKSPSFASIS
jgi:hypothetical protein